MNSTSRDFVNTRDVWRCTCKRWCRWKCPDPQTLASTSFLCNVIKGASHCTKAICEHCLHTDRRCWQPLVSKMIVALKLQIHLRVLQGPIAYELQVWDLFSWLKPVMISERKWSHAVNYSLHVGYVVIWALGLIFGTCNAVSSEEVQC